MKIWHISDTHGHHNLLTIPENIDMVIFSGDESNSRDPYLNEPQARDFINWFAALPIEHKIFTPGNHSTAIERNLIPKDVFKMKNIIYLENDFVYVEGYKIWASPYSPTYGDWVYMKARHNMDSLWKHIPEDTDILVTHTPPKGVLDLSYNRSGELEFCGCRSLFTHVLKIKPKFHLFGHIHNLDDIKNAGTTIVANCPTIFSNGAVVEDGKFGKIISNGNIFNI